MKFDDLITYIGEFGTYQKKVYALVCLPAITIAMQAMSTVFTLGFPDHRCAIPGLGNDTYNSRESPAYDTAFNFTGLGDHIDTSCYIIEGPNSSLYEAKACDRWVYDQSTFKSSLVTELDLVCDKKMVKPFVQMLQMLGSLCGVIFLGLPADIFGRKKVMTVCIIFHVVNPFAIAFTPNITVLCILVFLSGASNSCLYVVTFVIGMELVGPSKRLYTGYIIVIFFALGAILLPVVCYFLRHWQHIQFAISAATVAFLFYPWLMPESARWLISKGRYSEAEAILRKAAKVNGVELPDKAFQWESLAAEGETVVQERLWKIMKYPRLLKRTSIIYLNWFACGLTFYGLSWSVGSLGGSIYLNAILYGTMEVISGFFCMFLLDRIGRKPLHFLNMFIAGICCILSLFPKIYGGPDLHWLTVLFAMLGKFGVAGAFSTIWLYSSELFPTVIRSGGVASSSFFGRIGALLSPYIANLSLVLSGDMGFILSLLIFGSISIVAGFLSLYLPETKGRRFPDTLQDANQFGKRISPDPLPLEVDTPSTVAIKDIEF